MDAIQPVGTLVNPPNLAQGFAPLSALLGIQRQQQQLQAGAAEVQQQQQTAQQRKAIAGIDWSKYDDGTGTISTDKMLADPDLRARSGDQFLTILQAGATARQTQIQNKQQLQNLRASSRVQFGSVMGRVYDDPAVQADDSSGAGRKVATEAFDEFAQEGPEEAAIARIYKPVIEHAPPGRLARGIRAIQLQAMDANGQITTTTPQPQATTNKAGQIQFVNTNANAPQGVAAPLGPPVEQGLGPEARATPTTLANGQPAILNRANGTAVPVSVPGGPSGGGGPPRTAQDEAPPPNAPPWEIEQFRGRVQAANQHQTEVHLQDADYGNQMAIADQVRKLSADTRTGPGSQTWNHFWGRMGVDVSNRQQLESFLDRQAAGIRGQMGIPQTNAGAAEARTISGNIEMQRDAIQAKNSYNEALAQGLHDYRQGLDRVAGYSGNPSPTAVQRFRSAWASAFDPRAYEWKLAMQRGDTEGAKKILSGLTPAQIKQLQAKGRAIDALSQGQVP